MLPVLAILVFGTVDLGRAYQLKNQLKNAAREGAAYAQVYPLRQAPGPPVCNNPDNVRFRAQRELGNPGGGGSFTIGVTPTTGCDQPHPQLTAGQDVTVTASKDFDVITPFVGALTGDPIRITESVTVVIQR